MSDARLQHHVFSSDGGYRTTFVSPELPPATVKELEVAAYAEQTAFQQGPAHACRRLADGQIAITRTIVHGADHVGRKRICSHTILLQPEAVFGVEGFNPAEPAADLFMDAEVPAERPGAYLVGAWRVPEGVALNERRGAAMTALQQEPALRHVLAGLLAVQRTLVVAGPLREGFRLLGLAAWLLPPEMRRRATYRAGTWTPAQVDAEGAVSAVVLPDNDHLREFSGGQYMPVDLSAPPGYALPVDTYAGFVAAFLDEPHAARRLASFLGMLTAFPGPGRPSRDQQSCFIQGYAMLEPVLLSADQPGEVVARAPGLVRALCPLAKSGREAMARWLVDCLDQALPRLERPAVMESMKTLRQELAENLFLKGSELGTVLAGYGERLREVATGTVAPR